MNARFAGLGLALVLVASACGGTAVAPSAATGSPAAAASEAPATAAPTAETASAAMTPTAAESPSQPTLTEQAGTALLAFEALIARPDLTFRARGQVSVFAGETAGTFDIERAVSGASFSERMTFGSAALERVLVDGTLYTRTGDGAWTKAPASPVDEAYARRNWLYFADTRNVAFVSPYPPDKRGLLFTATKPFRIESPELTAAGAQVRVTGLSLVLLPTGEPLWMGYASSGRLPVEGGGLADGQVSGTLDFSDVGTTIVIEAPIP